MAENLKTFTWRFLAKLRTRLSGINDIAPIALAIMSTTMAIFVMFAFIALANAQTAVEDRIFQSPQAQTSEPPSEDEKAAACARTVSEFIAELDDVMSQNPGNIKKYYAVLARNLFLRNGVRGLPPPKPDASVKGCKVDQVIETMKRSKFFYAIESPPRYDYHLIEFRNRIAKVHLAINKTTGNILGPGAQWIMVYP